MYLIIFTLNTQDLIELDTSFVRYGAKVWNNISTDVRELGRIKFNKIIKKSLLTILELEDDYVDEKLLVREMAKQRKQFLFGMEFNMLISLRRQFSCLI